VTNFTVHLSMSTRTEHDGFSFFIFLSCVVDSTVTYFSSPQGTRRFSFDTFQFTGGYGSFVYLHCNLVVCNASDTTSRCSVGCSIDFPRRRRAMEVEKGVVRAGLTEGPFIFSRDVKADRDSYTEKGIHDRLIYCYE